MLNSPDLNRTFVSSAHPGLDENKIKTPVNGPKMVAALSLLMMAVVSRNHNQAPMNNSGRLAALLLSATLQYRQILPLSAFVYSQ